MEKNLSNGAMLKKKLKRGGRQKNCSSLFFWLCTKYLFYCQYALCELWFYWTRLALRQSSRNLCAGMSGCKQHFETFSSKIWYWFLEVMVKEIGQQGGALVLTELGWSVPKNSCICVQCEVEFSSQCSSSWSLNNSFGEGGFLTFPQHLEPEFPRGLHYTVVLVRSR